MKYVSPSGYYNLEIPSHWMFEESGNTTTFYDEGNGFGAVNITSYEIPESYIFNVKSELIQFIGDSSDISDKNINVSDKGGQDMAFIELIIERYWLYYVIYIKQKALFVTYNCDSIYKENERRFVDLIIRSIIVN